MAKIIVGEAVISKTKERGTIIAFDGVTISVQYAGRVARLQADAFEKGFLKYANADLQGEINNAFSLEQEKKEQAAEEKHRKEQAARDARASIQAQAPIGVTVNSASIRLERAEVSLASVKTRHKALVKQVFDECDKDVGTLYDAFHPDMRYVTPRQAPTVAASFFTRVDTNKEIRPIFYRSRYAAGFLTRYGDVYVLRVLSRNDVYTPGVYGGFTVGNTDIAEIIRVLYVDGELYCFSKHLSFEYGKYKNSTLFKKWQASSQLGQVVLDEVVRLADCRYLNDYIEAKNINCLNYARLLMAGLCDNKAEIVFKHRCFTSVADIEDIVTYFGDYSSKQIDFAARNNVIRTLPFIKNYGLFDTDVLVNLDHALTKRDGNSVYDDLTHLFVHHGFDMSLLDRRLIAFLRNQDFNANIYADYLRGIYPNPAITLDDVFDREYEERHLAMLDEQIVRYSMKDVDDYNAVARELSWIDREENGYHIIIPKSIPEFRYEGQIQHNCVYTLRYFREVIDRKSIIVFVRREKDTPFVTVEFDYNTFEVWQAYGKHNRRIDPELYEYICDLGRRLHFERLSQE